MKSESVRSTHALRYGGLSQVDGWVVLKHSLDLSQLFLGYSPSRRRRACEVQCRCFAWSLGMPHGTGKSSYDAASGMTTS